MSAITLLTHQVEHYARIQEILDSNHYIIDISGMGSGKTPIHVKYGMENHLQFYVVGSVSAYGAWSGTFKQFGSKAMKRYDTYSALAGKVGKYSHPYLERKTVDGKSVFTATKEFVALVKSGVYIIFDECQAVKNANGFYGACSALISTVLSCEDTQSRVALLSGCPIQEHSHTVNYLRMLIKDRELYSYNPKEKELKWLGMDDIIRECKHFDEKATLEYLKAHPLPVPTGRNPAIKDIVHTYCHEFFVEVLMKHVCSSTTKAKIDAKLDIANLFCTLPLDQAKSMAREILDLGKKGKSNRIASKFIVEKYKSSIYSRLAIADLSENKTNKVVVMLDTVDMVTIVTEALKPYGVLVITGEDTLESRVKKCDQFNDNPEIRALVGTLSSLNASLNLQDTKGKNKRSAYYSGNYDINVNMQACMRIYRVGCKSDCKVRVVYLCVQNPVEASILAYLDKKSKVVRSMMLEPNDEVIPDMYPKYTEPNQEMDKELESLLSDLNDLKVEEEEVPAE